MRRRILLTGTAVVLLGVVVLAQAPVAPPAVPPGTVPAVPAAEPIPPTPPRTLPETPATPVPPAGAPEAPLNRFEPLSSFPESTQSAVAGVVMGADWMVRRCEPNGRFMFGYNPSLRQPMAGDHDLKQARGALALAQAAKFTGDKRQAAIASQAILVLLAATRTDPADANCRVPVHSSMMCNRVGFAGVVALAIYELPNADRKLLDQAEQLCEFLHR